MNDIDKAKGVFVFIDKVNAQEAENMQDKIAQKFDNSKKNWNFMSAYLEKYRKAEAKLPYHINLIDELHADENAHSRILAKLLKQKSPYGKYEILESFVRYLATKSVYFGNIHVKNPDIMQEIEHIDLWIRDKAGNYAIIVENKIHWASDQKVQLSRYIDKTKGQSFEEEQIYVIYLSPIYDKTPDEQTWGSYKEKFQERFINLSYKDDILSWLINEVLPNVRLKDKFLSSALEQYIDSLEGLFDLRTINKQMNMELQEFIKQELGLTGNPQDDFDKLWTKQDEINKISYQIDTLRNNCEQEIFKQWKDIVKEKYTNYQQIDIYDGVGLEIPVKDTSVQVMIGIYSGDLFYQVNTHSTDVSLPQEVIDKVGRLLPRKSGRHTIWAPLPRVAHDEVFRKFCEVVEILINS